MPNQDQEPITAKFNPNESPMVAGGVSLERNPELKSGGWEAGTIKNDYKAVVVFSAPELPGGVRLKEVIVPAGTPYLYNKLSDQVVMESCGNGSSPGWRELCRAGNC